MLDHVDAARFHRPSEIEQALQDGEDLRDIDLRGTDLRGLDLRQARHIVLRELAGFEGGAWVPLAAWDKETHFPEELETMLWLLGLRDPDRDHDEVFQQNAMASGRRSRRLFLIDKSQPGCDEVQAFWWVDG